jgi:hypothetical protein
MAEFIVTVDAADKATPPLCESVRELLGQRGARKIVCMTKSDGTLSTAFRWTASNAAEARQTAADAVRSVLTHSGATVEHVDTRTAVRVG